MSLGLFTSHFLQGPGENDCLARNGRILLRLFSVEDFNFLGQPLDNTEVMVLTEIGGNGLNHRVADLVESVHLGNRFLVSLGNL